MAKLVLTGLLPVNDFEYDRRTAYADSWMRIFDTQELRDNLFDVRGYPYLRSPYYSEEHRALVPIDLHLSYEDFVRLLDQAEELEKQSGL